MVFKTAVLLGVIPLIIACRSGAPSSEGNSLPGTMPVQPANEPSSTTKRSWLLTAETGSRQYQVTSISSLELTGVRDSVTSAIRLTLNSQPSDTVIIFSGTVDSVSVLGGSRIGSAPHTSHITAFAGRLNQNLVSISAPSACRDDRISMELIIPNLLFRTPNQQIIPGYTWTDSTRVSTCYGSIPVLSTIVHSYRVLDESTVDGRAAILLSRADRIKSQGAGSQEQHQIELEAATSGSAQVWIDSRNGQVLRSTSGSSGTLTITASGRRQIFNQTTRTTIASR